MIPHQTHRKRPGSISSDGIYRRRKLVTVALDALKGMLYARNEIRAIEDETPGFLGREREDLIERHFIVTTRRYGSGGYWEAEAIDVHHNVSILMPEEVLEALRQQRESIISAQRKDNAVGNRPPTKEPCENQN